MALVKSALCCTVLAALSGLGIPAAHADQTLCVADFAGLQSALASWATQPDGSQTTLQLVQGTYAIDNASGHTLGIYMPAHAAALRMLGGYAAGCDEAQRQLDPRNTVIDGQAQNGSQLDLLFVGASVLIEGLTFTHLGQGLQIVHDSSQSATGQELRISHCRIIDNIASGTHGPTLRLWGSGSGAPPTGAGASVVLENSLVADNSNTGVVNFSVLSTSSGGAIVLRGTTIANNDHQGNGFQLQAFSASGIGFQISNTIAWHNGHNGSYKDFDVSAAVDAITGQPPSIAYTLAGVVLGTIQPDTTNLAIDPKFIGSASGNYRLRESSPAFDSGAPAPPGGYGGTDLDGQPRVLGNAIDRGAYETVPGDYIFFDGFDGT